MRRLLLPLVLMLFAGGSCIAESPFACNMNALSREERQRYGALSAKLVAARVSVRELANGYEWTLKRDGAPLRELAEWIELESRCCPFLTFGVELRGDANSTVVRLTGGKDVKEFIKAEFGME
jgi:hypothetical protein